MVAGTSTRSERARVLRRLVIVMSVLGLLAACASAGETPVKSLPTSAPIPPRGSVYVALGSSFAAGPRIPPNQGGRCLRSNSNYAHLVSNALGLRLTDVSCSGALAAGLDKPTAGAPSQLSALTSATRLVTLTVGGNDIGYAADLGNCTTLVGAGRSCLASTTLLPEGQRGLLTLRRTLITVLSRIRSIAPRAQIYLLSYLAVLPASGLPCPPNVPLLAADAQALARLGLLLRNTTRSAAIAANVHFVDAYTAGLSHTACALPTARWVEGTQRVLPAFEYHPNARGMAAVANLLLTAIRRGD